MSKPQKTDKCAYCGNISPITDDHIPPKNLFPKPRASDLITVPCCERCREGWSKDDEYFRNAIVFSYQLSTQGVIETILRSARRPSAAGFTNLILNSFKKAEIISDSGIYLGEVDTFKLDVARIDRVGQRIIKGLFFKEKIILYRQTIKLLLKYNNLV